MMRDSTFLTLRPFTGGGLVLALALSVAASAPVQAQSATVVPEVLHRFGATDDDTGRRPFAPPVWLPATGDRAAALVGTTIEGGASFSIPIVPGYNLAYSSGTVYSLAVSEDNSYRAASLGGAFGQPISSHLALPDGSLFAASTNASEDPAQEGSARIGVLFHLDGMAPTATAMTQEQSTYYRGRGQLAADGSGNVYFGSTRLLMRRNADGSVEELVDFNQFTDSYVDSNNRTQTYLTHGADPQILLWSERDSALYIASFVISTPHSVSPPDPEQDNDSVKGFLVRISADALLRGVVRDDIEVLHRFYGNRDKTPYASDTKLTGLVEDGDWLYGTSSTSTVASGNVWRFDKAGQSGFQIVHDFSSDVAATGRLSSSAALNPRGPLVRAADGNIYGTVGTAGLNGNLVKGAGAIYRIKTGSQEDRSDDALEILHVFSATDFVDGTQPVGLSAGPVTATTQWVYGATERGAAADGGVVYRFAIDVPPVRLTSFTANDAAAVTVDAGEQVLLAWATEGASVCEPTGEWAGSGAKAASGSEQTAALAQRDEAYVFGLRCRSDAGVESEETQVRVTVQAPAPQPEPQPEPTPQPEEQASSSGGGGGALGALSLLMLAGALSRRRR